jgi:nucleoside-diphosphate kinase
MEQTLVIVKPDGVQRHLVGRIIDRLERKGLKIVALCMRRVDESLARKMYAEHEGKDFYEPLTAFITSGPVVTMVVEGYDVISMVRSMIGSTFGPDAAAGTIRGDFGASRRYNLVHASDSPASAKREIGLMFRDDDILRYNLLDDPWTYACIDRETE